MALLAMCHCELILNLKDKDYSLRWQNPFKESMGENMSKAWKILYTASDILLHNHKGVLHSPVRAMWVRGMMYGADTIWIVDWNDQSQFFLSA